MKRKANFVFSCSMTERRKIIVIIILRLLSVFLSVTLPLIFSELITSLVRHEISSVRYLFLILITFNLLTSFVTYVIKALDSVASKNTNYCTRKMVSKMLLAFPNCERNYSQGKMYALINNDANSIYTLISLFSSALITIIKIAVISIIIFRTSWILSLILLVPYPLVIFLNIKFRKKLKNAAKDVVEQNDTYLGIIKNTIGNIQDVAMQGGYQKIHNLISKSADKGRELSVKQLLIQINVSQLISIVSMLGYFLLTGSGIFLVLVDSISFGIFLAACSYSKTLSSSIESMLNMRTTYQPTMTSVNRIFEIHEEYEKLVLQQSLKKIPDAHIDAIECKQLSLSFGEKNVLKNVNIKFEKGHIIGLIGSNGSGKTSLMNIIMQNLHPTDGTVEINGTDIFEYNYMLLRSKFEYVGTNKNIYYISLRDNILLSCGRTNAELDNICKTVGIYDDIMKLPDGYDTIVSGEIGFSSGQIQKFQLARAFLKDSDVLILDEALSNLDDSTRKQVCAKLREIAKEKIIIIISHYKPDFAICDEIYNISEGYLTKYS